MNEAGPIIEEIPRPELSVADYGTDLDASLRFVKRCSDKLRHCRGIGWLHWDGKRWACDAESYAIQESMVCARSWTMHWVKSDGEGREMRIKTALGLESAPHIRNAVELAARIQQMRIDPADLDSDSWLLNVFNGTLDLRSGKLRPHDRSDRITKLAPVNFDPLATHPTLTRILTTIARNCAGMDDLLARCFGAALTGDPSPETLFLLGGDGASGKTTLTEGAAAMLGDYAVKLPFESFCQSRHGRSPGGATPDLVKLRGARLAYASEGDVSARLDAGTVKTLTGGEPFTARALYSEPITIQPTWKLWLVSNYDPKCEADDSGVWRRLLKLHFHPIPEAERDPRVKETLCTDPDARAALLAWAVRGCQDWLARGRGRRGLAPPASVVADTEAYRVAQDTTTQWWDDLLASGAALDPHEHTTAGEIRRHYDDWCSENGAVPLGIKRLSLYLSGKGLVNDATTRGSGGVRRWRGIKMP